MRCAEAVLASAARRDHRLETLRREGRRRRARQDRAAAGGAADRARGPRRHRLRHRRRRGRGVNAGDPHFAGEAGLAEALAEARRRRAPARDDRHHGGGRRGARPRRRRAAADGRRRTPSPTGRSSTRSSADIGAGPAAGHHRRDRDDAARRHDARADRPRARGGQRPARRGRLRRRLQPRARSTAAACFRDLDTYPKLVGGLSAAGEARGVELYGRVPGRRGAGDGLGRGGRADEARRDDLPRPQHRVRQRARRVRRPRSASTSTG